MKSKLNIDPKVVDSARQHAANIAHDMQEFIERHTTVSTERTIKYTDNKRQAHNGSAGNGCTTGMAANTV